jgi:hypothetical protein
MARSTLKRRAINQEGTADVMVEKKKKKKKKKNDRQSQAAVAGSTTINYTNASKQTSILSFWGPTTIVTTKNYKKKEKETTMPITNANDKSIVCQNRDRFMKTTTTITTTTTATINQRDSCSDKDSNNSNNNANKIILNNSSCKHKIKNEEDKNKNKADCLNADDDGTSEIKTSKDLSVQNNNDNDNDNNNNNNNNNKKNKNNNNNNNNSDDDEASDNVDESNTKEEEPEPEQQYQLEILDDTMTRPSSSTSSSSLSSSFDNDDNDGLSDYEKLRLRNIARNNARLASLGLLSSSLTATATNTTMTKTSSRLPRKKRSTTMHHQDAAIRKQPIRRSSRRNRFSSSSSTNDDSVGDSIIDDDNGSDETKGTKEEKQKKEEEEKECYTVSPLLQYEMTTTGHATSSETNNNNSPKDEDNNIDTTCYRTTVSSFSSSSSSNCLVVKKGPRFIPPKGLNAIYSLDFWKNNNIDNNNNNNDRNSNSNSSSSSWLVGAGKSGIIALWDTNTAAANIHNTYTSSAVVDDNNNNNNNNDIHSFVDPILYWKGHSGRWIADAKFIPGPIISTTASSSSTSNNAQPPPPSRLVTAGNDGTVCLWDLSTVSISTGIPKLLNRTGKALHTSGIFCMDVTDYDRSYANNNYNDLMICTGSKDKSIAISSLESITNDATGGTPIWTSRFHTAKVGSVKLQSPISTMLASASDDGSVAIHDYRMNGNTSGGSSSLVAKLENAHARPHSVLWDRYNDFFLVTAGLDPIIKVWDQRNLSEPILCLQGHVPNSTGSRCKKIHRPTFFYPGKKGRRRTTAIENSLLPNIDDSDPFLLTGGQGSTSVSMYQIDTATTANTSASLFSRGKLPIDCGNAGCIAVNGNQVAVTVDQGEIIILEPSSTTSSTTNNRS